MKIWLTKFTLTPSWLEATIAFWLINRSGSMTGFSCSLLPMRSGYSQPAREPSSLSLLKVKCTELRIFSFSAECWSSLIPLKIALSTSTSGQSKIRSPPGSTDSKCTLRNAKVAPLSRCTTNRFRFTPATKRPCLSWTKTQSCAWLNRFQGIYYLASF